MRLGVILLNSSFPLAIAAPTRVISLKASVRSFRQVARVQNLASISSLVESVIINLSVRISNAVTEFAIDPTKATST